MKVRLQKTPILPALCLLAALITSARDSHAQLKTSGHRTAPIAVSFDHLDTGQMFQVISVSIRFFGEVEAEELKLALRDSGIQVETFRFVSGDVTGEVGIRAEDSSDASFQRLVDTQRRLLGAETEFLSERLKPKNTIFVSSEDVRLALRRNEWQGQELMRGFGKIEGMEVRGPADLVKNFCNSNAFVRAADLMPPRTQSVTR